MNLIEAKGLTKEFQDKVALQFVLIGRISRVGISTLGLLQSPGLVWRSAHRRCPSFG